MRDFDRQCLVLQRTKGIDVAKAFWRRSVEQQHAVNAGLERVLQQCMEQQDQREVQLQNLEAQVKSGLLSYKEQMEVIAQDFRDVLSQQEDRQSAALEKIQGYALQQLLPSMDFTIFQQVSQISARQAERFQQLLSNVHRGTLLSLQQDLIPITQNLAELQTSLAASSKHGKESTAEAESLRFALKEAKMEADALKHEFGNFSANLRESFSGISHTIERWQLSQARMRNFLKLPSWNTIRSLSTLLFFLFRLLAHLGLAGWMLMLSTLITLFWKLFRAVVRFAFKLLKQITTRLLNRPRRSIRPPAHRSPRPFTPSSASIWYISSTIEGEEDDEDEDEVDCLL
jgi:hypothetical protein